MTDKFFIVGSGRCGTKLLRRMLVCHPAVEACMETHFLPTLYDEFGFDAIDFGDYFEVIDAHYDSKGAKWTRNLHEIEEKDYTSFKHDFSALCTDLETATAVEFTERFHQYLFGPDISIVGDKTPHYGTVVDIITEYWPKAKFIHIVRDGVHAADSMTRHSGFRKQISHGTNPRQLDRQSYRGKIADLPDEPISIDEAARFWEEVVTLTCEQGRVLPDGQYTEIRYEDMLVDPQRALRRLGEFLDLSTNKRWLRDASRLPYPFYLRRIDTRLDEGKYNRVYQEIAKTMERFDYPADNLEYEVGKELNRSISYYQNRLTSLDYWRTYLGRRL